MYRFFQLTIAILLSFTGQSVFPNLAVAQNIEERRPLEHDDYDLWNSIAGNAISNDGKWVYLVVQPGKGDATLKIREVESDREYSVLRGQRPEFSFDSRFVVYTIQPDPEVIKKLRADKKDPKEFPQSSLEILELETGKHTTIPRVSGFSMPDEAAGWIAFKMIEFPDVETVKEAKSELTETFEITEEGLRRKTAAELEEEAGKKKEEASTKTSKENPGEPKKETGKSEEETKPESKKTDSKKDKKEKKKDPGTTLVLRNLETSTEQRFPNVLQYRFDKAGMMLAFTTSAVDTKNDGVHVFDLVKLALQPVLTGTGNYGSPTISEDGRQVAFLTDRDDYEADKPSWSLYLWKFGQREATKIADAKTKGVTEGWWVSSSSNPQFSEDGRRLYFATAPLPEEMEIREDDPMADPVAKLDIWHWQDPFLQPQQLLQVEQDRNRDFRAVYDITARKIIQLATLDIPVVSIDTDGTANIAVGIAFDKYNKMRSWDVQAFADSYLVDLKTGNSRLILDKSRGIASLSPAGKFITFWDGEKQSWFALPAKMVAGDKLPVPVDIGKAINHPLYDELHDTPDLPGSYGIAGWLDDDTAVLIYDRWDIWQVDPAGKQRPVCLTDGQGRKKEIRFRYVGLDPDERTIDLDKPIYLSALVHKTKASGYYRSSPGEKATDPRNLESLITMNEDLGRLRKARDTDAVMLTRSTFERCPDLWASTLEFKTMRRISRINPQQNKYLWGTAELVHWNATDGQPLDGLLYKPDGFDPQKKYPMLVYFYERNSDNLHSYYEPAAGRSIINFSFYVSRGYVLFVPDIPYRTGEPGPSAANAILPGVQSIYRSRLHRSETGWNARPQLGRIPNRLPGHANRHVRLR